MEPKFCPVTIYDTILLHYGEDDANYIICIFFQLFYWHQDELHHRTPRSLTTLDECSIMPSEHFLQNIEHFTSGYYQLHDISYTCIFQIVFSAIYSPRLAIPIVLNWSLILQNCGRYFYGPLLLSYLKRLTNNNDAIQINKVSYQCQVSEDQIHLSFTHSWCITESKWHNFDLEEALWVKNIAFPYILGQDWNCSVIRY